MAPSTFASAAAGIPQSQNSTRDAASEWSRRTNGATQTFRRPSGAAPLPSAPQQPEQLAHQPPRYVPPHRNGNVPETRYSKDQLLDLFRAQQSADGGLSDGLQDLLLGGWQPDVTNGSLAWGRAENSRDPQPGLDICWDKSGAVEPLGLMEMDEEEKELFMTSVNTPIKPPASATKETHSVNGLPTRKMSLPGSSSAAAGFGLPSPSMARGPGRRREPSESYPFPQNPVTSPSGFTRDEQRPASPPPSLVRRRTDLKDLNKLEEHESASDETAMANPFGSLKRHPTGPLGGTFGAPSSPWSAGPQSAGLSPMGSFGSFGITPQAGAAGEKRAGLGGGRAESRFKNLLNKDIVDEGSSSRTVESKASSSSLSRGHETESWRKQDRADNVLDEADEHLPSGSAALSADAEVSPPHPRQGYRAFGTPSRHGTADEYGFSAFGMTSDNSHTFGHGFLPGRDAFHQSPAHQRVGQVSGAGNEPMSPTDTNPYQSPEQHGVDRMAEDEDHEAPEAHNAPLPGLGGYNSDPAQLGGLGGLGALPNLGHAPVQQGPASDRSQTSSVGPHRGFSGLGGLGQFPGGPAAWPVSQGSLGTPARQPSSLTTAFGGGIFANPVGDLQSPSLAGLGGGSILSPQGSAFGASRMASMFPSAMQDQMRQNDQRATSTRDANEERMAAQPFGVLADASRAAESPFANQGHNDSQIINQPQGGLPEELQYNASGQHARKATQQDVSSAAHLPQSQQPHQVGSSASNQPPAPQQRTMVMPDRMRWIYRDPQGQTQGPWSGLEMHDWYKAGFFSPELLVKKYEDPEYEPLAQLIRRIGNSREPFLVPQIGIPHGPPSNNGPTGWAGSSAGGSAQPPFASSFPSFGTTLTAEQQNALERRKQEEQYLMARQKEHLAQAQIAHRMQMQSGHGGFMPGQLHHHSSAHSLQSQPSFGSMTSPTGYQQSPVQGPSAGHASAHVPGFFDNSFRQQQPQQQQGAGLGAVGAGVDSLGQIREEEIPSIMDRLNLGSRPSMSQFGAPGQPFAEQSQLEQLGPDSHAQRVQQMMQDRIQLEQEQAEHDAAMSQRLDEPAANDRLQQFEDLQSEAATTSTDARGKPTLENVRIPRTSQQAPREVSAILTSPLAAHQKPQESLSLTEQVQKAASAKDLPAPPQPGLPHPFPPAPSQSPLPAPAAQRTGRQTVADQLQTESRERSQTPSTDTPSAAIAPWAKEPAEAPKGPSLREIQEAEAKKAAEMEELAAAARRAAFQKEMEAQAAAAAVAQPGLPAGATWATGSPATPTGSAPAAWTKAAQKSGSQTAAAKSMAQIQKEEEARKKKLAAAVAAASAQASVLGSVAAPAGGKSYANLAGKVSAPAIAPNAPGGAWTTVGAGGKPKTPAGAPAPAARAVSAGVVPTLQTATTAVRKPSSRASAMGTSGGANAQEEFRKWAVSELRPDLNKGISADDFVAGLVFLPAEADIITEAVHGVSSTIDSRHFADEFIRRKKLADKGIVDTTVPPKSVSPYSGGDSKSGGWSEVAKKGPSKEPAKEEANGNFRMVAAKKKGGKR